MLSGEGLYQIDGQMNEKFVFRVSGMAMTFTALLTAAGLLIFNFLTR